MATPYFNPRTYSNDLAFSPTSTTSRTTRRSQTEIKSRHVRTRGVSARSRVDRFRAALTLFSRQRGRLPSRLPGELENIDGLPTPCLVPYYAIIKHFHARYYTGEVKDCLSELCKTSSSHKHQTAKRCDCAAVRTACLLFRPVTLN